MQVRRPFILQNELYAYQTIYLTQKIRTVITAEKTTNPILVPSSHLEEDNSSLQNATTKYSTPMTKIGMIQYAIGSYLALTYEQ